MGGGKTVSLSKQQEGKGWRWAPCGTQQHLVNDPHVESGAFEQHEHSKSLGLLLIGEAPCKPTRTAVAQQRQRIREDAQEQRQLYAHKKQANLEAKLPLP